MLNRPFFSSLFFLGSVSVICCALAVPSPAMAGFQWVSPAQEGEGPLQPQAPAQAQQNQPLVIQAPATLNTAPTQPVARAPQTLQVPQEGAASGAQSSFVSPAADREKVVRGFANNVPLAVALRQILPSEYGFSAAQDVPLSTLVSWQGGRSWRSIMDDMLRSVGLTMREQNKMIHISRSSEAAAPVPQTLPANPEPKLQPVADNRPMTLLTPPAERTVQPLPPAAYSSAEPQAQAPYAAVVDTWTANRGETLRKVLENWTRRANVDLTWQAEYDYPLQATATFTGTFEDAVRGLLTGFQEAQPQPVGTLHNSSAAGQTVLVIQTRGNNYSE